MTRGRAPRVARERSAALRAALVAALCAFAQVGCLWWGGSDADAPDVVLDPAALDADAAGPPEGVEADPKNAYSDTGPVDSGESGDEVVDYEDPDFAERAASFYASLANRPLDAYVTFEDVELREYFPGPREFADYYASLARQVRDARFRRSRIVEVEVRELHFEAEDLALVDVRLVGRHERVLLFWDVEVDRRDAWRLEGDTWLLTPEKL